MRTINSTTGSRYSAMELRDIAISVVVLSVAFAIAFSRRNDLDMLLLFGISAVVVCTSFVIHELAHKFVAQRFGAWAEYRMFPFGLLVALLLSFTGLIFAAPGAVYIKGYIDRAMNGKISAAGPAVNIVIGVVALVLAYSTDGLVSSVFWIMASINAFFAVFNMLPIPPFDGSKIYGWNVAIYLLMMAAAVALLATAWFRFIT
ncbi:MAG: site-2 protease family protein [Methanomassiliicoccaceae archaeon]|jgi:Zn-dependent protease|nr:site-2 protease family protein [Methanomassiliicoccaceae archaeon]